MCRSRVFASPFAVTPNTATDWRPVQYPLSAVPSYTMYALALVFLLGCICAMVWVEREQVDCCFPHCRPGDSWRCRVKVAVTRGTCPRVMVSKQWCRIIEGGAGGPVQAGEGSLERSSLRNAQQGGRPPS